MEAAQVEEGPKPRSAWHTIDTAGTVIGFVALAGSLLIGFVFTGFFAMATDACFDECNTSRVGLGIGVTVAGLLVAIGVALGGVMFSASRGWVRTVWPFVGIAVVVLAVLVGGSVADTA